MGGNSPCASCKLLRRRCAKDCIFAPYFPSDDPHKFAIVHKVFGASNVSKMLQELQTQVSQLQMQLAVAQAEIFCIQMQQEQVEIPAAHQTAAAGDGDDGKSFFLHDALPEYLNFASSSSVIHDSLKRESLFSHDMVS